MFSTKKGPEETSDTLVPSSLSSMDPPQEPFIHIIRHGQSLHNVDRKYTHRDPPLTATGEEMTRKIKLSVTPDLIIISPMTRTIQTAMNAFPELFKVQSSKADIQIWPDLREAHDAICNKGLDRDDISALYPELDFTDCPEVWDKLPPHTTAGATARAEKVRRRLKELSQRYHNIVLVTHRGFIAFLVRGPRFDVCETRTYRFATDQETASESIRIGINLDTDEPQDFGPTLLVDC